MTSVHHVAPRRCPAERRAPAKGHEARLVALAAVALACASARGGAPAATPPFEGVGSVVLVREVEAREKRPRDVLDALDESLRARGLRTRTVEVGPALRDDLKDVARVVRDVEWTIRQAPRYDPERRPAQTLGRDPGALLERLDADAFAVYLRLRDRFDRSPRPMPPDVRLPGADPEAYPSWPIAVLALVDRDGTLLWFDWGGPDELDVPDSRVVNAAEAVDEAVRVLVGEPPAEEEEL
ncbi:MAG TPA: hypothetical protein VD838_16620 [Anaeromyxobacteraceae bacterium]|nr:hypothetical protein [Anaeromyxobacteraceae bacterium]